MSRDVLKMLSFTKAREGHLGDIPLSLTINVHKLIFVSFSIYCRAQGMGFLQITARIGSALAPWVAKWLKVVHIVLPFSLMGGSTFVAALLLLWLPETADKATAEILENISDDANSGETIKDSDSGGLLSYV